MRETQNSIRAIRFELEAKLGASVLPSGAAWPWLVRHAAWAVARFLPKGCGTTASFELHGAHYARPVVCFGETVLFRQPVSGSGRLLQGKRRCKADSLWVKGVWCGKSELSDEHMCGRSAGVQKVRTIRRLTSEARYDRTLFWSPRGAPWGPLIDVSGVAAPPLAGGPDDAPDAAPGTVAMHGAESDG